jgi:hypothetical protein
MDNFYVKISVTRDIHKRLKKDRDKFKKELQLSSFTISDTINEYLKIIYNYREKLKKCKNE